MSKHVVRRVRLIAFLIMAIAMVVPQAFVPMAAPPVALAAPELSQVVQPPEPDCTDTITVAGYVYDGNYDGRYDDQRPLAGATVELDTYGYDYYNPGTGQVMQLTTNSEGYFEFDPIYHPQGSMGYVVTVRKDGFVRQSQYHYSSPDCSPATSDYYLEPGHTIINTFVDADTEEKVDDSDWWFSFFNDPTVLSDLSTTYFDRDGVYRTEVGYDNIDDSNEIYRLQVRDVNNYPYQFVGPDSDYEGKGSYYDATSFDFDVRGSTNLGSIALYAGSTVRGVLYDNMEEEPLQDAQLSISAYNADGSYLGDVSGSIDSETGAYTTTHIVPGEVTLRFRRSIWWWWWSSIRGNFGEEDEDGNTIWYSYLERYYSTDGRPDKESYHLGTADTLTIPNDGSAVEGQDIYFDRCAKIEGKVQADGEDITYNTLSIPDYYGEDNPWTLTGSGAFSMEGYDPSTGSELFNQTLSFNSDGEFSEWICSTEVATLGTFKYFFEPGSTSSPYFTDENAVPPQYDYEYTNYDDTHVPNWYNQVYTIKEATEQALGPGDVVEGLVVNFEQGATVRGQVTDEVTEEPIEDAYVTLQREDGSYSNGVYTDETGHYTFTNASPGKYIVEFEADGYQWEYFDNKWNEEDADVFTLGPGDEVTKDAALREVGDLSVTILDKDGEEITNTDFTLYLYDVDSGSGRWINYSGWWGYTNVQHGSVYTFTDVLPGNYKLWISGWGYESQWYDGKLSDTNDDWELGDTIVMGKDDKEISTTMQGRYGKGTIRGRVLREDTREPIYAGGVVELYDAFSGDRLASFPTDRTGRYEIERVPDGTYKMRFRYGSLVPEWHKDVLDIEDATVVEISGEEEKEIDTAELAPGGRIGVTVMGGGEPVTDIEVWAEDAETGSYRGEVWTDNLGTGIIYGLPAGDYILRTDPYEEFLAYESEEPVSVTVGQQTDATITLEVGARLIGRVVDADSGEAINDARVSLYDGLVEDYTYRTDTTNSQGFYQINGVEPGDYKILFSANGYKSEYFEDAADWEEGEVVVIESTVTKDAALKEKKGGYISGRVTIGDGQPAQNVSVLLYDPSGGDVLFYETTDPTGRYIFKGLEDGDYKVKFEPRSGSGYAMEWYDDKVSSAEADIVAVSEDSPSSDIDAVLEEAPGVVWGTVKVGSTEATTATLAAEAGTPFRNTWVSAYLSDSGDYVGSDMTSYDGMYEIAGLRENVSYKLITDGGCIEDECYAGQWWDLKPSMEEADAFTTTAQVSMTAHFNLYQSGISGKVTTEDGTPLPRSEVYFSGSAVTLTDDTGAYTVTTLMPGDYTVEAKPHRTMREKYQLVESAWYTTTEEPDQATVPVSMTGIVSGIDIVVGQAGSISGTVTLEETGKPAPGVAVSASGHGCGETDARGQYMCEGLPPDDDYTIKLDPKAAGVTFGYPEQYHDRVQDQELATEVVVEKGETTVQDILLAKDMRIKPASIMGTIYTEETPMPPSPSLAAEAGMSLEGVEVKAYNVDEEGNLASMQSSTLSDADGEYTLEGLIPGTYKLYIVPPLEGDYPSQWYDRVSEIAFAREITVGNGEDRELDLLVAMEPGVFSCNAEGTGGKWECQGDEESYETYQPGKYCWMVPSNAVSGTINVRVTRRVAGESSASLAQEQEEMTYPKKDDGTNRNVAFFFDIEAYWPSSGEPLSETLKSVTLAVPYSDPEDLTLSDSTSPSLIIEPRLTVQLWNSESYSDTDETYAPGWYNADASPWCESDRENDITCSQAVDAEQDVVTLSTNTFYDNYVLLEGDPLNIFLPTVMKMTSTATGTLTLR